MFFYSGIFTIRWHFYHSSLWFFTMVFLSYHPILPCFFHRGIFSMVFLAWFTMVFTMAFLPYHGIVIVVHYDFLTWYFYHTKVLLTWFTMVFTALHICNAVFPIAKVSVRPSVRHTRELWQNERKFRRDSYTEWKVNSCSFSDTMNGWWGTPLVPEISGRRDPVTFKNGNFHSIIDSEKSSIVTNSSSVRAFQWA